MPVFGDYETLAKPLFTRAGFGQARAYWVAKRRGAEDRRDYFIKSIAWAPQQDAAPGPSSTDPSADFFESIARLHQTQRAQPERIAPIHAFGRTESELWYATDYYPRQSLAQFCSTAADITNAGLEHVVNGLASACLALQQGTGRSHGNLKPSNILLAGEAAPLRETPLHLIDIAGFTSLRQSMETDPSPTAPDGEPALREAAERRDLLGIGRILLQLVESNAIEGPADYTLPIRLSLPWRALGEDSRRWLDLCNRLLAPNLSLDEINLESLTKAFPPVPPRSRTLPFTTGISVVLIAGACFTLWSQPWKLTTRARTRPQTVVSALPSAAKPVETSVHLAQVNRPTVAIPPVTRKNTAALPAMPEKGRPTSSASLASTPKQVASFTKDKDRAKAVPARTGTKRTDASPPARARQLNPVHVNSPALSSTNSRAQAGPARTDAQPGKASFRAGTAGAHLQPAPSAGPPASARSDRTDRSDPQARRIESGIKSIKTHPEVAYAVKPITPSTRENTASLSRDTIPGKRIVPTNSLPESARTPQVFSKQESQAPPRRAPTPSEPTVVSRSKPERVVDQATPVSTRELDEQLRSLETRVGRAVALRRHSELFSSLDSLQAQYAKSDQLTSKTRKRLELLRANMAKKLPGASPANALNNPFSAPPMARP